MLAPETERTWFIPDVSIREYLDAVTQNELDDRIIDERKLVSLKNLKPKWTEQDTTDRVNNSNTETIIQQIEQLTKDISNMSFRPEKTKKDAVRKAEPVEVALTRVNEEAKPSKPPGLATTTNEVYLPGTEQEAEEDKIITSEVDFGESESGSQYSDVEDDIKAPVENVESPLPVNVELVATSGEDDSPGKVTQDNIPNTETVPKSILQILQEGSIKIGSFFKQDKSEQSLQLLNKTLLELKEAAEALQPKIDHSFLNKTLSVPEDVAVESGDRRKITVASSESSEFIDAYSDEEYEEFMESEEEILESMTGDNATVYEKGNEIVAIVKHAEEAQVCDAPVSIQPTVEPELRPVAIEIAKPIIVQPPKPFPNPVAAEPAVVEKHEEEIEEEEEYDDVISEECEEILDSVEDPKTESPAAKSEAPQARTKEETKEGERNAEEPPVLEVPPEPTPINTDPQEPPAVSERQEDAESPREEERQPDHVTFEVNNCTVHVASPSPDLLIDNRLLATSCLMDGF